MAFLKNLPEQADVFDVFTAFPDFNKPLAEFCENVFRGPSSLTPGERQTLFAYVSGLNACQYCYGGHAAAAVAYGLDKDVFDALFNDIESAPVDEKLKPLLRLVRKLTLDHTKMVREDIDAAYDAGWDDEAIHAALSCCCLANYMNRLVEATGVAVRPELFEKRGKMAKEFGYWKPFEMKFGKEAEKAS